MLRILIGLNLIYCVLSLAVVLLFWNELTVPGKLYLFPDVLVLLFLINFERRQLDLFSAPGKS